MKDDRFSGSDSQRKRTKGRGFGEKKGVLPEKKKKSREKRSIVSHKVGGFKDCRLLQAFDGLGDFHDVMPPVPPTPIGLKKKTPHTCKITKAVQGRFTKASGRFPCSVLERGDSPLRKKGGIVEGGV